MIGKKITYFLCTLVFLCAIISCNNEHTQEEPDHSIVRNIDAQINEIKDSLQKQLIVDTSHEGGINICAVGDMMLGTGFPKGLLPPLDGKYLLKNVAQYLKGDVVFGNLEGCLADTGRSLKCDDSSGKSCYAFRMPTHYATHLKNAGFNILSAANNHINDYGKVGRYSTMHTLDSMQLAYGGLSAHPFAIIKVHNKLVAFTAFSPNTHTLSIFDFKYATQLIKELKSKSDIVIVSFHGGAEGDSSQHVTQQMEYFFGEPRGNVYQFAHMAVDAGADILIGQGPHVTRAAELYKNKLILYSLGNFCTYGKFNLSKANGYAPIVQVHLNDNGDFAKAQVISIKQQHPGGPSYDEDAQAYNYLKMLTESDFPNTKLYFENNSISVIN